MLFGNVGMEGMFFFPSYKYCISFDILFRRVGIKYSFTLSPYKLLVFGSKYLSQSTSGRFQTLINICFIAE